MDWHESVSESDQHKRVRAEQVRAIYQQAIMTSINSWATGLVLMFIPNDLLAPQVLYGWFAILTASCLLRLVIAWRFRKADIAIDDFPRWGIAYAMAVMFTGMVWASALFILTSPEFIEYELLIMMILVATCVGAAHASTTYPLVGQLYNIPVMTAFIVNCFLLGTPVFYGLAALGTMYAVMMFVVGQDSYKRFVEVQRLRFELARKKEEAENANIAKSKFLAAASHDLRQPLQALTLFTTTLKSKITYPEVAKLVANIDNSVEALQDLFNALLDISKLDAGTLTVEKAHVSLGDILAPIKNEFQAEAADKGLRLIVETTQVCVYTDPALLSRIIRNLVANAIRYTDSGLVKVSCKSKNQHVLLEVIDTGCGIAEHNRSEIFEEFVQLHNPERDRKKGMGLGLAIVRRLVSLLDYTLVLQSEPGRGTTFALEVPLGDVALMASGAVDQVDSYTLSEGLNILVIDDEADIREGAVGLLESWGSNAWAFADAAQCLAFLDRERVQPDLILADYRLRDNKTGVQAINEIIDYLGRDVPAAIITGDTAPDRIKEAEASGYLLMHKPIRPMQLRAFLNRVRQRVNPGSVSTSPAAGH